VLKLYVAYLSHQKDKGTSLQVDQVTLFQLAREAVGFRLFGLVDAVTFDWTYEVRWGPKDPVYGLAERSAGHLLFRLGQWLGSFDHARRDVASIPVTPEWVREHMPEARWPWE
jgi:hypothetical protein